MVYAQPESYDKWMQQTGKKEYESRHDWVGKGDPLRIVQEIKVWPCWQMVYVQNRIT